MLAMAINDVGKSIMVLFAITVTDPTRAPTRAALMPSTNALKGSFLQFF